jgi:hypothetical protein
MYKNYTRDVQKSFIVRVYNKRLATQETLIRPL